MRRAIKVLRSLLDNTRTIFYSKREINNGLLLLVPDSDDAAVLEKKEIVISRLRYFCEDLKITEVKSLKLKNYVDFSLIGLVDSKDVNLKPLRLKFDELYNFDYENFYSDGWEYHRLLTKINAESQQAGLAKGLATLKKLKKDLSEKFSKSYILGTGPSLEKAIDVDFSDGVRIVSNTIVKDQELWLHINPHFITAGDAIYHFGPGKFAQSFRSDLKESLAKTDTYFVFPSIFYAFCLKEFSAFKDKLIPIPGSRHEYFIHRDLTVNYELPATGNVLPLLLLPLACTLTKNVNLWGFDGRSPNDKLFWKNSSKHFYSEHVEELMQLHPAFFNKLVPKNDPASYVKTVHGDALENAFVEAEKCGFTFTMMHFSYTENLNKRYAENKN